MATNSDFATCKCGCREHVSGKSIYRPGHDARHVSRLLATSDEVLARTGALTELLQRATSELASTALQAKFVRALEKKQGKAEVQYGKKEHNEVDGYGQMYEDGEGNRPEVLRVVGRPDVKIGRWFYPARELHTEDEVITQRNTKRDGSGDWEIFQG